MLTIQLQEDLLEVNQLLSGRFYWTGDKTPKQINLTVSWRTQGRGTVDSETIYSNSFTELTASDFSCKLPALGPISYDGQILRVIWEVSVEAIFPGILSRKQRKKEVKMFRVIPKGG
ncbi:MAG: hypothetical protein AAFO04_03035 [Cyanobacteria bacterium J06592_8]